MSVTIREVVFGGTHWRLVTPRGVVHVFDQKGPGVVVYVHGYQDNADSALTRFRLLEQFSSTGTGGVYIIPEAPASASQAVQFPDLDELLAVVQADTGLNLSGTITAIGHSGAYRTLLSWLGDSRLNHIVLLDALYAGVSAFIGWGVMPGHNLDIIVTQTGAPRKNAEAAQVPHVLSQLSHFALITPPTSLLPGILQRLPGKLGIAPLLVAAMAVAAWLLLRR
jgi:hypothetical protein